MATNGDLDVFENYFRLHTLVHHALRPILRDIFHRNKSGNNWTPIKGASFLPDETLLYKELDTNYREKIKKLKTNRIINNDQYNLIFPQSGRTNSDNFDVTLLVVLIRNLMIPPDGSKDWNSDLHYTHSDTAVVDCALVYHNKIFHTDPGTYNDHDEFQKSWDKGERICRNLGSVVNFTELKTLDLRGDTHTMMISIWVEKWRLDCQFKKLKSFWKWTVVALISVIMLLFAIYIPYFNIMNNQYNLQDVSVNGNKLSFTILVNNVSFEDLDVDSNYSKTLKAGIKQYFKGYFTNHPSLAQQIDAGLGSDFKSTIMELRFVGSNSMKIPDDFYNKYHPMSVDFRSTLKNHCKHVLEDLEIRSNVYIVSWRIGSLIVTIDFRKETGEWGEEEEHKISTMMHERNFSIAGLSLQNIKHISLQHHPYFRFEITYGGISTIYLPLLNFYLLTGITISWFMFSLLVILLGVLVLVYASVVMFCC